MPDAELIEKLRSDAEGWKALSQAGWAALHNIREVLERLAPPGSMPDPNIVVEGPEHVREADLLIQAIYALHERAVAAETKLEDLRRTVREGARLPRP